MFLSASFQSMEFHCLDKERASADLSSFDVVEVSAVDIIHDSPSIVDQWHVCILSDYPYGLSVTLHDGIRFLPPPTPTVPSLPLARSVPLSGRTSGFPCSMRKTFRSVQVPSLGRRVIVRSMMGPSTSITRPKYRFGPCVLPFGSDSFSHVVELQPLRRFILHSPCRTHPSSRIRRIPNVSALFQGLHTFILLRTHALVGSMGNESHGYFTFPFFTFLLIAFMSHTGI